MDPTLIVPTGNVVSMFFVFASAFVYRERLSTRALAVAVGVAAALLTSTLPTSWMGDWPRVAFLVGFVPPLALAAVVLRLRRG